MLIGVFTNMSTFDDKPEDYDEDGEERIVDVVNEVRDLIIYNKAIGNIQHV